MKKVLSLAALGLLAGCAMTPQERQDLALRMQAAGAQISAAAAANQPPAPVFLQPPNLNEGRVYVPMPTQGYYGR